MTCELHPDGRHRLIVCDDLSCCPKGYVERCYCGAVMGNAGRRRRSAARKAQATGSG